MLAFLLFFAGLAVPPAAAAPAQDQAAEEIIVTGTRPGKCRMQIADRALSEREFEVHAGEWARLGRAIRVVHPANTHYRCLARIAFRLNDHGVWLVHFVDQGEAQR
jgi:flavin-binding protein dodecin